MWQVIYITSSKTEAVDIEKLLQDEGFMVKRESISENEYQIKVLESEASDAYKLINER